MTHNTCKRNLGLLILFFMLGLWGSLNLVYTAPAHSAEPKHLSYRLNARLNTQWKVVYHRTRFSNDRKEVIVSLRWQRDYVYFTIYCIVKSDMVGKCTLLADTDSGYTSPMFKTGLKFKYTDKELVLQ